MLSTTGMDRVGSFLAYALGGLGIIDDYDEILADLIEDNDHEAVHEFHKEVLAAVSFTVVRGVELGTDVDRLTAELNEQYEEECRVRGIAPRK